MIESNMNLGLETAPETYHAYANELPEILIGHEDDGAPDEQPEVDTSYIVPSEERAPEAHETDKHIPPAQDHSAPLVVKNRNKLPEAVDRTPTLSTVWGRGAVRAADEQPEVTAMPQEVAAQVKAARAALAELDEADTKLAASFLNLSTMAPPLCAKISGDQEAAVDDVTLLERLTATNEQGAPVVSDRTLLDAIREHNARHEYRQERYDSYRGPEQKQKFELLVHRASWSPEDAVVNVRSRLPQTRILLDDGFGVRLSGMDGLTSFKTNRVVVGVHPTERLIMHELAHIITGADPSPAENSPPSIGLFRIFGENTGAWIINEAVTEHAALSWVRGGVGVLDPHDPHHDSREFVASGLVLETLCTAGEEPVNVRLFINALFENGSTREALGSNSAAAQLVSALYKAFPHHNIIENIGLFRLPAENIQQRELRYASAIKNWLDQKDPADIARTLKT